MRPGSISKQYRDRQRQRGVYYQLSYTHKMRSRTEHVWPDHVKGLRKETEEYKKPHSFINRGKNPKKIVAGAFGIRLIWNLPKHQTFQPKSHIQ